MKDVFLTLEQVNKWYDNKVHAVKDVNLEVNEGGAFGICRAIRMRKVNDFAYDCRTGIA